MTSHTQANRRARARTVATQEFLGAVHTVRDLRDRAAKTTFRDVEKRIQRAFGHIPAVTLEQSFDTGDGGAIRGQLRAQITEALLQACAS